MECDLKFVISKPSISFWLQLAKPVEINLANIDIAEFVLMERAIGVISIGISIS